VCVASECMSMQLQAIKCSRNGDAAGIKKGRSTSGRGESKVLHTWCMDAGCSFIQHEFPIDPTCVQEHKGNEAVFRANECQKGCYMFLTVPSEINTGALTERQASTIRKIIQVEYLVH